VTALRNALSRRTFISASLVPTSAVDVVLPAEVPDDDDDAPADEEEDGLLVVADGVVVVGMGFNSAVNNREPNSSVPNGHADSPPNVYCDAPATNAHWIMPPEELFY
jgi:hypothetical protein